MRDEMQLLGDLRPAVAGPTPDVQQSAREALLAQIAAGESGRRRFPRFLRTRLLRRWVVPCLAVVGLGAAGVGLAGSLEDWWSSAGPAVRPGDVQDVLDDGPATGTGRIEPQIDRARTVATAPGASLVVAPTEGGGYCLIPVPDEGKPIHSCSEGDLAGGEFATWVDNARTDPAWYLLGRIIAEGAARIELFERVTHPLQESGAETLPGTPVEADVGPGGFFLARVPRELWPDLDLAYGQMAVLDKDGAVLEESCHFLGATKSVFAPEGIAFVGDPLMVQAKTSSGYPCPETGAAVDRAPRLVLAPPRDEDLAGVAGRDVVTGETIELARYFGRPLLIGVWDPDIPTAARFLEALDEFGDRHPDVQIVSVLHDRSYSAEAKHGAEALGLGFPTIVVKRVTAPRAFTWDAHGQFGLDVIALEADGRIAAELAAPRSRDPIYRFGMLTQKALENVFAAAGG